MQQLAQDMRDMEEVLVSFSEKIMEWDTIKLYEGIQDMVQPMTNLVVLVLNNKELFEQLNIDVEEKEILSAVEDISCALEHQDDVLLLDAIYQKYLPWLKQIEGRIREVL